MKDLIYKLALTQIPHIGPILARNAVAYCGGVEEVFKQSVKTLIKIPGFGMHTANALKSFNLFDQLESEILRLQELGIEAFFFLDDTYPYRLKQLPDAPIMLFKRGQASLSPSRVVAIVGTRKMTAYGKSFLKQFMLDLKQTNCTVVSGMAYGIDVMAHQLCLDYEINTIGVMAHGLDIHYPPRHTSVGRQMLEVGGALVTEFVTGTPPDRENFPKRNRIIAGMADVVLVIESAEKGGSLITAHLANQYDREVMAVPGNVNQTYSKGCNLLIKRNRAHVLEELGDLMQLMQWDQGSLKPKQLKMFQDLSGAETRILELIRGASMVELQQLVVLSQQSSTELAPILLELELKNCIYSLPGMRYRCQ